MNKCKSLSYIRNFAIILEAAEIFIIVVTGRLRDEARLRRGRLRSNSFSNEARERVHLNTTLLRNAIATTIRITQLSTVRTCVPILSYQIMTSSISMLLNITTNIILSEITLDSFQCDFLFIDGYIK